MFVWVKNMGLRRDSSLKAFHWYVVALVSLEKNVMLENDQFLKQNKTRGPTVL